MVLSLIGFMGSGKSSVGRILARELNYNFIDLDDFIEEKTGRKIKDIFSEEGEAFFRKLETEALGKVFNDPISVVLATGGGAVTREENRELLKQSDSILFLRTRLETIQERLRQDDKRPLLACEDREDKMRVLYEERMALYSTLSTIIVDTDVKSPEEVALSFVKRLKKDGIFDKL